MTTPTIPDLPTATSLNNTDQFVVRQPAGAAGTDKKVTAQLIRNIDITALSLIPNAPSAGDLMLISQGGSNYRIKFEDVGFVKGNKMWFFHDVASDIKGWSLFSSPDTLLAVKGSPTDTYSTGGSVQGTWQQEDHTLTISEIPSHDHTYTAKRGTGGSNSSPARGNPTGNTKQFVTDKKGGGNGHNHGNSWRPQASVGIICQKN